MISIGVLTPHAAGGPEAELPDMAPRQLAIQVSRIPTREANEAPAGPPPTSASGLASLAAPAVLNRAAAVFAAGSVDVIGYASTSTGYAIGFEAEASLMMGLSQRCGLPVVSASTSACAALQAFHVRRVAVVHPPWFDQEMNDLGAAYFRSQGFEVVSSESAELVNDPKRVEPGAIVEWISRHVSDDAEAVFIGGTGFRAARAIEPLEQRLSRPILESNQVLLWAILAQVDVDVEVKGYGRLLART